jgi:hypothetical protein
MTSGVALRLFTPAQNYGQTRPVAHVCPVLGIIITGATNTGTGL